MPCHLGLTSILPLRVVLNSGLSSVLVSIKVNEWKHLKVL